MADSAKIMLTERVIKPIPFKTLNAPAKAGGFYQLMGNKVKALRIILLALAFIAQPAHAGLLDALRGDVKKESSTPGAAQPADKASDNPNRNLAVTQTNNVVSDKRIALVIGNGAYTDSPLKNPTNDARDMARKLRGLGFDVIERFNLKTKQINECNVPESNCFFVETSLAAR